MKNPLRHKGGFTLIEMMVVIVIIVIVAGALLPRLPDVGAARLKYAARKLGGTITYVYDRSAATQLTYRLTFDLGANEFYVSRLNRDNQFEETELAFAKRTKLPANVRITSAETASQGNVAAGKAVVHCFPGGFADYAVFHLADNGGNEMTLIVHSLTGRVEALEGYHAAERNKV
ncbi:MAG: prepilin-type N-terminal cleavage/methylation domain-containing protein [Nitrospinae bacterium]|nr:prepilin-type N-terminal cleavage/methylation domain-containing protein [Nitrospinota bacterium]